MKTITMRQFKHPNMEFFNCPVCGTRTDAPVVLVPKAGTERENIRQPVHVRVQVHTECYRVYAKMNGVKVRIRR